MNIPDKAVEAAANAMVFANPDLSGWDDLNQAEIDWYMRDAREALEAAAPFITAQALRRAADDCNCADDGYLLNYRADELDPS